jgi:hypothetical protein
VSDEKSFHTGDTRPGIPVLSDVVINEFLPNPIGADNAPRPGGEWVELYNNSSTKSIPLMGWYLKSASGNKLYLTNTNTTSMSIAPHGFVVVYRDGNSSFSLRNNALGDILSLHDNNGYIRDLHMYSFILGDEVLENKSFARFPDGSATWFDPIPTPNGANILDPELSLSVTENRHFASFNLKNIKPFVSVSYELIYSTDGPDQGLIESVALDSQSEFTKENILLGSCSTGGTCTYHSNINNLHLTVKLKNVDGVETVLNKTIE